MFHSRQGSLPLLISIPHHGAFIPESLLNRMTPDGKSSRDTDWYLERLYDLPETQDANWIVADWSRYVIDLNRPPDDQSLYPGQATTGLVPTTCFDGAAIYLGEAPTEAEIQSRFEQVWRPYHQHLQEMLQGLLKEHGRVVLVDAHSILSEIPRLFPGRLPDFNLGTNHGVTCALELEAALVKTLSEQVDYSWVANGRFVGGYITRQYGEPERGVHAVQIELAQRTYMDEGSLAWKNERAVRVQKPFRKLFQAILRFLGIESIGD